MKNVEFRCSLRSLHQGPLCQTMAIKHFPLVMAEQLRIFKQGSNTVIFYLRGMNLIATWKVILKVTRMAKKRPLRNRLGRFR